MHDFFLVLGAVVCVSCCVSLYTIHRAAGGYQDDAGFHYGPSVDDDDAELLTQATGVGDQEDS